MPRMAGISMSDMGTRIRATQQNGHEAGGSDTRSHTRDTGMLKRVAASITFTAADGKATGASNSFVGFVVGDPVLVQNTNLNNGFFEIKAIDAGASAFLVLDPPPKNEGPISCIIRTP